MLAQLVLKTAVTNIQFYWSRQNHLQYGIIFLILYPLNGKSAFSVFCFVVL